MHSHHFESFLREVAEAAARSTDAKLVADAVGECLRRLLAGSFFLDEALTRPDRERFVRHELHRGERFTVFACVFAPQQSSPIHDHAGWGVIAALTNRLIATNYRRLDDGLIPGFASLTEVTRTLVTESSFSFLRPPEESIHRLENPFRDPAVTLHILGSGGAEISTYDARAKSITPGPHPELDGV